MGAVSRFGITLDKGDVHCPHSSVSSICGYEYCLHCPYKFVGHCSSCEERKQALLKFFGFNQTKLDELDERLIKKQWTE